MQQTKILLYSSLRELEKCYWKYSERLDPERLDPGLRYNNCGSTVVVWPVRKARSPETPVLRRRTGTAWRLVKHMKMKDGKPDLSRAFQKLCGATERTKDRIHQTSRGTYVSFRQKGIKEQPLPFSFQRPLVWLHAAQKAREGCRSNVQVGQYSHERGGFFIGKILGRSDTRTQAFNIVTDTCASLRSSSNFRLCAKEQGEI